MVTFKPFKNQNYNILDQEHSSTRLFVDTEFPACLKSITHTGQLQLQTVDGGDMLPYIEWRRPHEIIDEPHFVVDGFQRQDLGQGYLGNCWFVAAVGALTLNGDLMAQVIPYDQMFNQGDYTGLFHFRFWLFGEWYDVVIDDRLPCYNGSLIFCRNNKDSNEFWAPLLEKAYAKVCGSYELMAGGQITDGLVDFTGGIDEYLWLDTSSTIPDYKEELKRVLYQAVERKSLVGCGIFKTTEESTEAYFENKGLVTGHSFSVTQIKDLTTPEGIVTLVRCLNPWNNSFEWNGDWSDNSPLWDQISVEEKRKLKFNILHDGEFWISFDDFFQHFDLVQMCHRNPESVGLIENISSTTNGKELAWHEELFHGRWKKGKSAGGSGLYQQPPEKYWTNPQYLIKLNFADDRSEDTWCTMIVALMFKENREQKLSDEDLVFIAFDVYKVKNNADLGAHIEKREKFYMTDLEYVGNCNHAPIRSVTKRFQVHPGAYVIIPNTFNYNEGGKYLLRIFTEKEADQTATIKLKRNKVNLAETDIRRPHVNNECESIDASDSSDEETNDPVEKIQTETESIDKQTIDNNTKQMNNVFSNFKSKKPKTRNKFQYNEEHCIIQ